MGNSTFQGEQLALHLPEQLPVMKKHRGVCLNACSVTVVRDDIATGSVSSSGARLYCSYCYCVTLIAAFAFSILVSLSSETSSWQRAILT